MERSILAQLNALRARRIPVIAVTRLESGEGRLVTEDSLVGDAQEEELTRRFRTGQSGAFETPDGEVFLGVYLPPPRLILIGAVHISQALFPMARATGFDVTIIDPRTAFATPERFPGSLLIADWPEAVMPGLHVDRFTAVAALTHVPDIDDFALLHAMERGCFYIGALGSRRTHAKRIGRLGARGASQDALSAIKAPIGLSIGAANPQEIAVSVMAEVIAALRQRAIGAAA